MTTPLRHPILSERAQAALNGDGFTLSGLYSDEQWDRAIQTARDGDVSELEWMLERDAAAEVADRAARHDPRYRDGHIGLSDWLGGRELLALTPVRGDI